jgi:hypothetical protein
MEPRESTTTRNADGEISGHRPEKIKALMRKWFSFIEGLVGKQWH